jgi:mRNA interferase MazF
MAAAPRRGDIYWVDFNPARGSEQAGKRPAVVVSNDINNTNSPVVIVAAITSQLASKEYPMNVRLAEAATALGRPGEILCGQLTTVAKERLGNHIASLGEADVARLNRALAKSLALPIPASESSSVAAAAAPAEDENA